MIRVLGGGVAGLTTAVLLLEKGYQVEVVAKSRGMTPHTALFEIPPFLTGGSQAKMDAWARETKKELLKFLGKYDFVAESRIVHISRRKLEPHPNVRELQDVTFGAQAFKDLKLKPDHPYTDAIAFTTLVIDSSKFLAYLTERILALGGTITKKEIDDLANETKSCDVVVNCLGLGARSVDPNVYPTYGQILLVEQPTVASCVRDCDTGAYSIRFPGRPLELGGIKVPHKEEKTVDPKYHRWIEDNCKTFLVEDIHATDHWVGLRPSREGGPRVETEGKIVHCYGFGGSGFTLCYGYAREAVGLVESSVKHRQRGKL